MYASSYIVTWRIADNILSHTTIARTLTIPNLAAGSKYIIIVTAHNDVGDTESDIFTATTSKFGYYKKYSHRANSSQKYVSD